MTVGAAEAMYNCMQAFVEKGDEVLIFEPFFDTCAWTWWTSVPVVASRTVLTLLTLPLCRRPCDCADGWWSAEVRAIASRNSV